MSRHCWLAVRALNLCEGEAEGDGGSGGVMDSVDEDDSVGDGCSRGGVAGGVSSRLPLEPAS